MNKYGWNSFRSGLACASEGGDIVGPEKVWLSEAGCVSWMPGEVPAAVG
jgi:hypothetical protein